MVRTGIIAMERGGEALVNASEAYFNGVAA
jgi:hypothetical protein